MNKGDKMYEGKAKAIFATDDPNLVIQYFKDDATAFDGKKKGTIASKGIVNCGVSSIMFRHLEKAGIPTHYVEQLGEREMLVKSLDIVQVEVVMRNIVAGSLSKRLGIPEGTVLPEPLLEWYYKSDELGDPMINTNHIHVFKYATDSEVKTMAEQAFKVNDFMVPFFDKLGIKLVDYKLEFGRHNGELLLGDEITPDGCRLWDKETNEKLDKDRFRRDLGNVENAYQKVFELVKTTV
jgi:phosphoribosylaminoimidazole-succinocarboxamide synthase